MVVKVGRFVGVSVETGVDVKTGSSVGVSVDVGSSVEVDGGGGVSVGAVASHWKAASKSRRPYP